MQVRGVAVPAKAGWGGATSNLKRFNWVCPDQTPAKSQLFFEILVTWPLRLSRTRQLRWLFHQLERSRRARLSCRYRGWKTRIARRFESSHTPITNERK